MLDIESYILSIKAMRTSRIYQAERSWCLLPMYFLNKVAPEEIILQMSFQTKSEMPCLSMLPPFYQEALFAYSKSKITQKIETKENLYSQLIWGNRAFKYQGKCLYSKSMIEVGICYIKDILSDDGKVLENIYLRLKTKADFFRDISLLGRCLVPYKTLRYENATTNREKENIVKEKFLFHKSKFYYNTLKSQKELIPISLNYWKKEFHNFRYSVFYENKIKYLYIIKIREFLFKVIHNICPCNSQLYRWKLSKTESCIYCNEKKQTIKHLLWECSETKNMWSVIENILLIEISFETLIIGTKNINMNNVISVVMYIIYKKFIVENNDDGKKENLIYFLKKELFLKSEIYKHNELNYELGIKLHNIASLL